MDLPDHVRAGRDPGAVRIGQSRVVGAEGVEVMRGSFPDFVQGVLRGLPERRRSGLPAERRGGGRPPDLPEPDLRSGSSKTLYQVPVQAAGRLARKASTPAAKSRLP